MNRYLLIAEKPSLMREIQACYNNHKTEVNSAVGLIDFKALAGHVCGLYEPSDYPAWKGKKWAELEYPLIPDKWKIKALGDSKKKKIIDDIKKSMESGNYYGLICATDSDTEGNGIFWLLENYLKLNKYPVLRFVEHSLTDKEILESLLNMTDFHTNPVHANQTDSFILRSRADWLYGMNSTCMMTVRTGQLLKIGRVKAPTINLVYQNSMAIDNFRPETYYVLTADYGSWKAELADEKQKVIRFDDKSKAPSVPLQGKIQSVKKEVKEVHAPKLYDLTSIQTEAGRLYKYSPAKTLELVQSLYEKKLCSYPRTECQYVSSEKAREFRDLLRILTVFPELKPYLMKLTPEIISAVVGDKAVVNDKEVAKSSHDAILPTTEKAELAKLSDVEKKIYLLICKRLLAQFLPKEVVSNTTVLTKHGDYTFIAKGKTVLDPGWRALYSSEKSEEKEAVIPDLTEGEDIIAKKIEAVEKKTTPPKRLTQASLINAMKNIANLIMDPVLKKSLSESQGLGTPATRAAIISDIIKTDYVREDSKTKGLFITELGKSYCESLDGMQILSPIFAAQMDMEIKQVQHGEKSLTAAYDGITENLRSMCGVISEKEIKRIELNKLENSSASACEYKCPDCGNTIKTTKYSYICDCGLKINKEICGKKLTDSMLRQLFTKGKTSAYLFKSKAGKKFKASLVLKDKKVEFEFEHSEMPSTV